MVSFCTKIKKRALLRNVTSLNPIAHNVTRWSSKLQIIERFERIYDESITVPDDKNSNVRINRSSAFKNRTTKFIRQSEKINVVRLELEKNGATLSKCRNAIDSQIESLETNGNRYDSPLYRCRLREEYIKINSLFRRAVCLGQVS